MDYLDAIRMESGRFYATADGADPMRSVPSCPDWTVADLVWHLAEVHWFWATDVEVQPKDPGELEALRPARPDSYDELVAFGRTQSDRLTSVLAQHDDATPVWTWALDEGDHTVGFIRRHQVQEAALHRWDIQQAVSGAPEPIAPEVAADSIDEALAVTLPWATGPDKPLPGTVHLHCTDAQGEWFVHGDGRVERAHAKGDAAIRGAASDLLLVLYRRVPIEAVEVIGDAATAREFLARINTS